MSIHFKVICKVCKDVIAQCRCPSHNKSIRYETCDKCKDTTKTDE